MKATLFFALLLALAFPRISYSQTAWKPYATTVSFKIKNAGFTVNGTFDTVAATLNYSTDKLGSSSLSGTAKVNSINTGIKKRDKDLKKKEYFDLDNFKDIEIKSVKLYTTDNAYAGLFDVTIKGVTKQVEIPFEFNTLANETEIKGTFTINRRDFGVGGSSMIMGDNVTVSIDIKAKK